MNYKNVNDYELMYMIRENDEDAVNMMYEKYLPLIRKIATKYFCMVKKCGIEFDDFVQEGLISLNRAIVNYDDNSDIKLFTYIAVCVERHYISYCRNINSNRHYYLNNAVYGEDFLSIDIRDCDYYMENIMAHERFTEYKNNFEFLDANIFELRFNGFSYKEIARLLDIKPKFLSKRLTLIRNVLRKKEKRLI